ncbi:MAG: hypothetical protein Q9218_000394 [Villophora microphyllina]
MSIIEKYTKEYWDSVAVPRRDEMKERPWSIRDILTMSEAHPIEKAMSCETRLKVATTGLAAVDRS